MNQQALFELYEMYDANKKAMTDSERRELSSAAMFLKLFCASVSRLASRNTAPPVEVTAEPVEVPK